jgi:hypothetical protein
MAFPEEYRLELNPPSDIWTYGHVQPEAWTKAVLEHLKKIEKSKAGFALLDYIQRCAIWIKVEATLFGECNAHGSLIPRTIDPIKNRMYMGIVKFDPHSYEKGSACYRLKNRGKNNRGLLPDEVLFHELLHAIRGALRLSLNNSQTLQGGLSRYVMEEEFLAVVLTNIYISDPTNRSKSGLRRDWSGGRPLENGFSTSVRFFQSSTQVLPLLKKFQQQQEGLFKSLAEVEAAFNPLYAMVHYPAEVEAASRSKLAQHREISVPMMPVPKPPKPIPPPSPDMELLSLLAKEAISLLE